MKILVPLATFLIIFATTHAELITPPSLSFVAAAEIAQATFNKVDKPEGSFIYSMVFVPRSKNYPEPFYKVHYLLPAPKHSLIPTPPADFRNNKSAAPTDKPLTSTFNYIKITMLGAASLVEEERTVKDNKIIRYIEKEQ